MKKKKAKNFLKLIWELFKLKKDKQTPVPKNDSRFSYDPNEQKRKDG